MQAMHSSACVTALSRCLGCRAPPSLRSAVVLLGCRALPSLNKQRPLRRGLRGPRPLAPRRRPPPRLGRPRRFWDAGRAVHTRRSLHKQRRPFRGSGAVVLPFLINLLSRPRGADQAAYAHTVKAPAPSLSLGGGLIRSVDRHGPCWCYSVLQSSAVAGTTPNYKIITGAVLLPSESVYL
jgi:hypothetical protein